MKKKYELTMTLNENGKLNISASNDGFSAFEILGVLQFKTEDIISQLNGEIKPDIIERTVIKNKLKD